MYDKDDQDGAPGIDRLLAEVSDLKQQRARLFAEMSRLRKERNALMVALQTVRVERDDAVAEAKRLRLGRLSAPTIPNRAMGGVTKGHHAARHFM